MTRAAPFTVAGAVVGLHVAGDSLLRPQSAASAGDRLAGGLIALVTLARSSHDHQAISAPTAEWVIPEPARTGGASARPNEYEHRVGGLFDDALSTPEGKAHP